MPPGPYAPSHAPAALHPPAPQQAIAILLLGLDLVIVAVTGEQPGPPIDWPAAGGPAADERAGDDPAVHQQPGPAAESALPPRVLIADDAAAMRAALRGLLADHGLPVIGEAADGLQAVTMAAELQADVVVMDVRMPGLDGLQATTRITGAHPTIRVVVYSVFDSDETQQAAHRAGAAAFVPKHGPPDHVSTAVLAAWQAASTTTAPPAAPLRDHPREPAEGVGCINAFMQLAGTRARDHRAGRVDRFGPADPCQ
jgi:CheY-like chemotaxis protein